MDGAWTYRVLARAEGGALLSCLGGLLFGPGRLLGAGWLERKALVQLACHKDSLSDHGMDAGLFRTSKETAVCGVLLVAIGFSACDSLSQIRLAVVWNSIDHSLPCLEEAKQPRFGDCASGVFQPLRNGSGAKKKILAVRA